MEMVLIDTIEGWEKLEKDWGELLKNSIRPYPFLEYWYLRTWWESLGGGEWQQDESSLRIVAGYQDGTLKAVAPLFLSKQAGKAPAYHFIGQTDVTDYLDFIASGGDLKNFLSGLLFFLLKRDQPEAASLDLANLQSDSPSLPVLEELCVAMGFQYRSQVLQPAPSILLPSSWETFLENLSKKQRHEVRRKERNVERDFETDLVFVDGRQDIESELRDFVGMMRNEQEKMEFLTPEREAFMIALGKNAHKHGLLGLTWLTLNGKKAAGYFNFLTQNRLWVYNTGWNPEFGKVSPGWVLLVKMIQWAIENGLEEVDLMRGDEEYKYRFGAQDREVVQVLIGLPQ